MKRFLLFTIFLAIYSITVNAQTLTVVTEEWEPYNFTVDGKPSGLAVEMVELLLKEAGIKSEIKFFPWNRAYNMAISDPNVMIFSMGRNAEREGMFKWVFKVAPREMYFYKLKARKDIKGTSINDLKKYMIGASSSNDAGTKDLINSGFEIGKNIESIEGTDPDISNLRKLISGRVDIAFFNPLNLKNLAQKNNVDISLIEPFLLMSGADHPGYWVAFSNKTDMTLFTKIKNASDKLEKSGKYKEILDKYTK